MTTGIERDDRVMMVMAAALALPQDERGGYVIAACDGDEELLHDVRDGITWEERMGGFLRNPWMSLQTLEHPFAPGQVVNNRFEIVREIGHGGMGIVYEAYDRKRGQRIAIKSARLGFRRLLTPELEAALKVRHPNVCLVNEIHTASTDCGEIDFLTMELLEGPTLQDRLAADGKLVPEEALEIVRQLCAGLSEAHRIGIVHKDLKPANVILAKMPDGSARAVITDFGLAGEPVLGSGELAGTPHYMAPELWRGAPASKASDLYALGVIAYEMLTGGTPFSDEPTGTRLTVRPPPPGVRVANVDAAIVRCLDPSPDVRPRDASELLASLTKRPVRKAPLFAAVLALLLVIGVAVRETWERWFPPANVRLAILPVAGEGEVAAAANGALIGMAERLGRRTGPPTVVVIPASRNLENGVNTPEQARDAVDATHVLQLALHREGNELVARGAVIELSTQTRLQEISGRYDDLSTALTGAVARALRLRDIDAETISPRAAGPYAQGLFYLRRDQHSFDDAIPLFRRAASLDAHSSLPLAGLVEAFVLKYLDGKDPRWLAQAERTLHEAQARNPDSVAVLLAAARLQLSRGGNYEQALANYRRVAELQPRNVEAWLRIAETNDRLDLRKEAIEAYRKAIELDPDWYQTYSEFGVFFYYRGEYANAAEQFRKVVEKAPGFYNAYSSLGATLSEMGEDVDAEEAFRASLKLRVTSGALNGIAAIRAYQRRDREALEYYRRALSLDPRNVIVLLNLGDSARRVGLRAEAEEYYQRGSVLASAELRNNPRSGRTRAFFGYFAARLGDARRGEEEIEQALQLDPSNKVVIREAVVTYETLGRRDRALEIVARATPDLLRELNRQPDLADFCHDPRFRELKAKAERGG